MIALHAFNNIKTNTMLFIVLSLFCCSEHLQAQLGNSPACSGSKTAANETEPKTESQPFTGSLVVRQKNANLYYQIYVVKGKVIGGYDTWRGYKTKYHEIVGGWYDGERMVLLIQSTQNDLGDKWYSQSHHFVRQGDEFTIQHTLYGFGKTIDSGEVYQPHTIDEVQELTAEEVRQLARSGKTESRPSATKTATDETLKSRNQTLEEDNTILKELVAELLLENTKLKKQRVD